MSSVWHQDDQTCSDKYCVALAVYLGYPLERIEVKPDGKTIFTVRCPELDWQQVIEEAANPETAICYKSFVEAVGLVICKFAVARKNGVWQRKH